MFEGLFAPQHIIIIGIIAVLLFGDRLPEVMRSFGKGVSEFKKGMQGIQGALNTELDARAPQRNVSYSATDEHDEPTAPHFQPPTSEPRAESDLHEAAEHTAEHESTEHAPSVHTSQPSAAQHSP